MSLLNQNSVWTAAAAVVGQAASNEPEPASVWKARCLHIINGEHFSGAERVQDLLGQSMHQFGYEMDFVALKNGKFSDNRQSTCRFHLEEMKSRLDFSINRRLLSLVQQYDYQLLHAHTPRSLMVGATLARKTGLPLVYHVHSPVGRDSTRWFQNKINLWIEQRSLRQAKQLIAVSDSVGEYMAQLGFGPDRLTVVPNGVPIVEDSTLQQLRKAPAWHSPWRFTLGTVALFRPRKGTEILLQALAKLKRQGIEVGVLAVGGFETSEYETSLKQLTTQLNIEDRVQWTGFTRDVNRYFPVMDLFALPSLFGEGLPMVVLESMAMGIPVIASRVEGIQQAIRPGTDGDICEPGNAEDLAQRIASLLESDLPKLGRAARSRQQESFSDQSMCQKTAAVYDQLLDRS